MSKIKMSQEDGRGLIYGDLEDWEEIETSISSSGRWSIYKIGIFRHIPSDKYYSMRWSEGATEQQDERPFEYTDPELHEVKKVEKVSHTWKRIED